MTGITRVSKESIFSDSGTENPEKLQATITCRVFRNTADIPGSGMRP